MLPPKEDSGATHSENITSSSQLLQQFEIEFSEPKEFGKNSVKDFGEKSETKFSESHSSSSNSSVSSHPGTPVDNESENAVVILDESFALNVESDLKKLKQDLQNDENLENLEQVKKNLNPFTQEDIGTVLHNLENVKTPEPSEMSDSIVRASFVDFNADVDGDELDNIQDEGKPEEIGEDDDAKEFSLSLNPDLPNIRAQQIRNWLEFEKENEKSCGIGNANSQILADLINNNVKDGTIQDFDLDSLSSHPGDHTLTDADGHQRRVRFLTDPQGNILISVFLTKLVHLLLTILKLATAGYLDFTSSKSNHNALNNCLPAVSPTANSPVPDYDLTNFNETDDSDSDYDLVKNHSSDGEEEEQQVIQVANLTQENGLGNLTIPEIVENQLANGLLTTLTDTEAKESKNDESGEIATNLECKESSVATSEGQGQEQSISETKKVINADPSLSTFDEGEDIGSDAETLSTSSCSSMIEVVPKDVSNIEEKIIEFIKDEDGSDENNNELKTDVINLTMPEEPNCDQSETHTIQPTGGHSLNPFLNEDMDMNQGVKELEVVDQDRNYKMDHNGLESEDPLPEKLEESREIICSGEVTIVTNVADGQGYAKDIDSHAEEELKFKPKLVEIEMKSGQVGNILVDEWGEDIPVQTQVAEPQTMAETNSHTNLGAYLGDNNPDEELLSLCIEEEPISAVALTIAKWESFSKLQQQQADSGERVNIGVKGLGKLILPSYTNNSVPSPNAKPKQNMSTSIQVMKSVNNVTSINVNGSEPTINRSNISPSAYKNGFNNKTSGWNNWTNTSKINEKSSWEDEEAIYAQPNSQAGSFPTNLLNPSTLLKAYPKPNSRGEIINWFKEGEIHRAGILLSYGQTSHHSQMGVQSTVTSPIVVSWFFGLITRQQAEELLLGQPTGTFLVRISTRVWGYTLSYQSNNKTKHFLISAINPAVPATLSAGTEANGHDQSIPAPTGKQQLLIPFSPGGRYAFIGTNMTPYTTLTSLIRHHSHAPITKAGGEKLLVPCPGGPKIAGIEYVFK